MIVGNCRQTQHCGITIVGSYFYPAGIFYLLKFNNANTRMCDICSKLTVSLTSIVLISIDIYLVNSFSKAANITLCFCNLLRSINDLISCNTFLALSSHAIHTQAFIFIHPKTLYKEYFYKRKTLYSFFFHTTLQSYER